MSTNKQQENQANFSSDEFVLVEKSIDKRDNELDSHSLFRSMDEFSTGSFVQSPIELNVVQNIKKLADDNEVLKKSLVRHNRMIEVGPGSFTVTNTEMKGNKVLCFENQFFMQISMV